ncbi:Putative metal-dependent hydrolase YfiT [Planctomycetes bacterium Pan216]|uniref:Metal-dependent hydrolase YfiT n=1 Tax=Kolteria novifilia TaxID=2527975 RepID=A0A518AX99_9BACT|nr:Putative metal-dependent hydrolase YfiT [Planctomycetes bacterium Pan216]
MMDYNELIAKYAEGPQYVRQAIADMSDGALDAVPIPGQWSTRQVVCHIADFELVYLDRMKRVIAESEPTFFGGDPDLFAARLAYDRREMDEELQMIAAMRQHMTSILGSIDRDAFDRRGIHAEAGPVTLAKLLEQITGHLPHHVRFIEDKRRALSC